ncbi:uncharacterized protein L969DRAFT_92382 [Mixia osmundae IAM 14324]|uniref:Uncharacterized protein n=1 Tax=Mixia osmundae (strain CBS 9802 / IAM 14324 / JCM 22182 / KY 12970) TaxID=764103 RepID=G7DXQ1_MIXOS|nr:uncharacterized protein L969DRAFT_92382 [Mixia osmundae IAM 14324]KEI41149.1 hypothetical protein L969DRAFT_92382 [Mixia osmundae IAM 14324]GAA95361.1 hypothetical protein E5Q_02018 [Mixia osmundae IAM 14324]
MASSGRVPAFPGGAPFLQNADRLPATGNLAPGTGGSLLPGNATQPSSASASTSLVDRVSDFVKDNKRAVLAAAGVVLLSGGIYYYASASNAPRTRKDRRSSKEEGESASGEETDANQAGQPGTAGRKKHRKRRPAKKATSATVEEADAYPTDQELKTWSREDKHAAADALKAKGNSSYASKSFEKAIEYYTQALRHEEAAVYFSNRAACYANIGQPERVIEDTTKALALDPTYVKALVRRANARESTGEEEKLYAALCDFTAAAILEQFNTPATAEAVERVMKAFSVAKAQRIMETREPRMPSPTFIRAYMEAFRPRARPDMPAEAEQGVQTLSLACDALDAKDYTHAYQLFDESLGQGISSPELEAYALNMRGTMRFIMGKAKEALPDLDRSTDLAPSVAQTWVKKASVHMELGQTQDAFADFDQAVSVNPDDPDIYYHRGQVHFIMGDYTKAIEEYKKSVTLDRAFIYSHIQLAVAYYKAGSQARALKAFEKGLREFGTTSGEIHNYYGEVLLDLKKFEEAYAAFAKAVEMNLAGPKPVNVLPLVNQALCVFTWNQDFAQAEQLCQRAITIDENCDVAVATCAQLKLQQNQIPAAAKLFNRAVELARTEVELVNAISYVAAAEAQLDFVKHYPEQAAQFKLGSDA